ncbi:MAG: hypothetical protein INR65_06590, partial [Gluconacetobacter diazotrophicus]|nr:hypothetical protein [Gluconacetobacter diazotrophicus]
SETRAVILDALRRAGREARVVFEASSLTAVEAAVRAGLGISAFSAISDTAGLRRLADAPDGIALPALGQVDLVIEWRPRPEGATAFAAAVREVLAAMERVGAVRPPGEAPVPLSGAP